MSGSNHDRVQALVAALRENPVAADTARVAADYISYIYDGFVAEAMCDCCEEDDICSAECELADDCPGKAERMEYVRDLLKLSS